MCHRASLILAAVFVLFTASGAVAQINTAEISGVARDASGGVLPGATVTATHVVTGTVVERVTDDAGRYYLPALRTGVWDITVSLGGFATQTQRGLVLEIGRSVSFDFVLGLSGLTE